MDNNKSTGMYASQRPMEQFEINESKKRMGMTSATGMSMTDAMAPNMTNGLPTGAMANSTAIDVNELAQARQKMQERSSMKNLQ